MNKMSRTLLLPELYLRNFSLTAELLSLLCLVSSFNLQPSFF